MKNFKIVILLFLLLISLKPISAQSYSTGVYVCDTINILTMQRTAGNCITYRIDNSLIPYVTGLTLNMKILDIYPCDTCVDYYDNGTFITQQLSIGDTLDFQDAFTAGESDMFQFYFNSTDTVSYQILALGTPTVPNEPYFCNPNVYNLVVFDACSGSQLYTLDGTKNCYVDSPTEITINSTLPSLKIYPNPFANVATLQFDNSKKQDNTLILYDLLGQVVRTINNITTDKVEIERRDLASGPYFFQLLTDRQIIATGKLMIE